MLRQVDPVYIHELVANQVIIGQGPMNPLHSFGPALPNQN